MFSEQLPAYEAAAKAAGDNVQTALLADAGHFAFIDPQSELWPRVLDTVRRLLGVLPSDQ
jgi:hypothetical protein